jgi:hypothetical protein
LFKRTGSSAGSDAVLVIDDTAINQRATATAHFASRAPRHPRNSSLEHHCGVRIAENGSATSSGVSKSAKVVLENQVATRVMATVARSTPNSPSPKNCAAWKYDGSEQF